MCTRRKVLMICPKKHKVLRSFSSITKASKFSGLTKKAIGSCLNGKRKMAGKYIWKYDESKPKGNTISCFVTDRRYRVLTRCLMQYGNAGIRTNTIDELIGELEEDLGFELEYFTTCALKFHDGGEKIKSITEDKNYFRIERVY